MNFAVFLHARVPPEGKRFILILSIVTTIDAIVQDGPKIISVIFFNFWKHTTTRNSCLEFNLKLVKLAFFLYFDVSFEKNRREETFGFPWMSLECLLYTRIVHKEFGSIDSCNKSDDTITDTIESISRTIKWCKEFSFHTSYCLYKFETKKNTSTTDRHLTLIRQILQKCGKDTWNTLFVEIIAKSSFHFWYDIQK